MSAWDRVEGAAKLVAGTTGAVVAGVVAYGSGATAEALARTIGGSGVGKRVVETIAPYTIQPCFAFAAEGWRELTRK